MPPKQKRSFRAWFRFGSSKSKSKVKGQSSGERHPDDVGTGISGQDPQTGNAGASLVPAQSDAVEYPGVDCHSPAALSDSPTPPSGPPPPPPQLTPKPATLIAPSPSLSPQSVPPDASTSLFANAHNFQLHNLNYYHQGSSQGLESPSRSDNGWKMLLEHTAPNALYDSEARFDPPSVDEETRVEVTERITTWIEDRESPTRLLCMTGAAGAGKSALQQTIAERYAQLGALAASFFFWSADPSRNNLSAIVPTIAYQLGQGSADLKRWIGEAVDNDHLIFRKSLKRQMDALVVGPVERLRSQTDPATFFSLPYLITIDALDECLVEKHQAELLSVIHACLLRSDTVPFRIFLASRPELPVRTALEGHLGGIVYHLRLSDDFDATDDIRRTFWRKLREIGARSGDPRAQPHLWPTQEDVEFLVRAANGQFVYAATVIRYISERRASPIQRLKTVLYHWDVDPGTLSTTGPFTELDLLYSNILLNAKEAWEAANPDSPYGFLDLLGLFQRYRKAPWVYSRIIVTPPFAHNNDRFCLLLGLDVNTVDNITVDLRSLVNVLEEHPSGTIQLYHRSFEEFLNTEARSGHWFCSAVSSAEFLISRLMCRICDRGADPDVVEGAAQSLPSAIFWLLDVEVGKFVYYGVSHQLYEAFLRFTQDQGWEKFFKHWRAGERYVPIVYDVGQLVEEGIIRLFASILEYSVDKDPDQEVIAAIRKHYAHVREQNAPVVARERRQRSNESDFKQLPFRPRFDWEDINYDYGPSWDATEFFALIEYNAREAIKIQRV